MSKATVTVEGLVARDVEVKYTKGGQSVANVVVPHTPRKREGNEWVDAGPTTWFEASLWDAAAESAGGIGKGDLVVITGQPQVETYEGRNGTGVKVVVRFATVGLVKRAGERQVPAVDAQTSRVAEWPTATVPMPQAGAQQGWAADSDYDSTPF